MAPQEEKDALWVTRLSNVLGVGFIVLLGGILGLVLISLFAFGLYGMPNVTSSIDGIVWYVWPIAGGGGCVISAFILYIRARHKTRQ